MRLVGTTKSTIQSIRERTHWNAANLSPLDPVTLGLCSQIDLDMQVAKAAKEKPAPSDHDRVTLLPASVTTAPAQTPMPEDTRAAAATKSQEDADVASVFAKLKKIGGTRAEEE